MSVDAYTGHEVDYKRCHWVQNYASRKKNSDFPETTAFERYAERKSQSTGTGIYAQSGYLGDTGRHNEGRVSTPICYLLV